MLEDVLSRRHRVNRGGITVVVWADSADDAEAGKLREIPGGEFWASRWFDDAELFAAMPMPEF